MRRFGCSDEVLEILNEVSGVLHVLSVIYQNILGALEMVVEDVLEGFLEVLRVLSALCQDIAGRFSWFFM